MRIRTLAPMLAFIACHATVTETKKTSVAAPPPLEETGIDVSIIDEKTPACEDFYRHACGLWLDKTPIPADKPAWSRGFSVIADRNELLLKDILEKTAAGKSLSSDPYQDKIGSYYAACMDEAGVEAHGAAELAMELKRVDAIKALDGLTVEIAREHKSLDNAFFSFGSQQDFKDATQVIGVLDQAGLGLPDRDYYLKDTAKYKELRTAYEAHVKNMLVLAGEKPEAAATHAKTVMTLERALAEASMSLVDRRDPKKVYHRIDLAGAQKTAPEIAWKKYLTELGFAKVTAINVAVPDFFSALGKLLKKTPIADLRTYLRWHVVHGAAGALPKAFVDETFDFYGKKLKGLLEQRPRWKRCVGAVDHSLGEAVGRVFVSTTFGAEGKNQTLSMIRSIEAAMRSNLTTLGWMDEPTKKMANEKLESIANKIGYPDKWRNYDTLEVSRTSYLQNFLRANRFETDRELAKIGQPLDRTEWQMSPPTVNAYYDPSMNEMVFPAGILQPPFYNRTARGSVNFGGVGMVMGHELTHGFDDEGRQFDAKGNLHDWWSPAVNKEFDQRAACVVQQFDGYVAVDDQHISGKLTLGENIADLGGIKLSHAAFVAAAAPKPQGHFTDEQLFYLGYAQTWCMSRRDEYARLLVATDPHSPAKFRVNGPLSNLPEFAAAFSCKPGDKMVRKDACTVW